MAWTLDYQRKIALFIQTAKIRTPSLCVNSELVQITSLYKKITKDVDIPSDESLALTLRNPYGQDFDPWSYP